MSDKESPVSNLLSSSPFIIAEIGSNFTTFTEAKDAISMAKQCGADAVKFQLHSLAALYGTLPGMNNILSLPIDWLPKLKDKANAVGIEFMCSAFSPELYDTIDPYVDVHKIASSEISWPQLLEHVKNKSKPIILSTGASSMGDVSAAMKLLSGGPKVVLMYCSSSYPSVEYNLFQIDDLKKKFDVPVGFSDHSSCVAYPALSAVRHFGATVIEKHVNFTSHVTSDSGHSLDGAQFKIMCDYLHGQRDPHDFQPHSEERDMFLRHNRRLIAIKPIARGSKFIYGDNFGAYRSLKEDTRGLHPFVWQKIAISDGATRDIAVGDGIGPRDFYS